MQAWLTRAVHELEAACAAKDIPESAVAKKLRGRGINLQDLKERAAEVERGLAGVLALHPELSCPLSRTSLR